MTLESHDGERRFRIWVAGRLDERFADGFPEIELGHSSCGSRLEAPMVDQSHRRGGLTSDDTHMRSICMHPKHAAGKQTCAAMIADPARATMEVYAENPCANDVREYDLSQSYSSPEYPVLDGIRE